LKFLYFQFLRFYGFLIKIGSPFNKKARDFTRGRKNFEGLIDELSRLPFPRIWFHFPSLGEFEQGRPVLEYWKRSHPEHHLVITFFSPSGFEIRKNYALASKVCYLPLDDPERSGKFIEALLPELVFLTKYDFWYFYIMELKKRNIPVLVLSAIFRPQQIYFRPYGDFFRTILQNISWFFVQDQNSINLLEGIDIRQASITGDTRFDRVLEISRNPLPLPRIQSFVQGNPVLVAGSTWPKDETLIRKLMDQDLMQGWKCILVPHEIDIPHLKKLDHLFLEISVLYSQWIQYENPEQVFKNKTILIVDQIGILSSLYNIAKLVYIGNGFGSGIHNTLEAAIYGKPLLFGPHYTKFREARDFIQMGAAFSFSNFEELLLKIRHLQIPENALEAGNKAKAYCLDNTGATQKIIEKVESAFMP
jgi:3-deoxy-D-manno-octulosonic-acid transferase